MTLDVRAEVLDGLSRTLGTPELRETHMSWVLLTADRAYKLKKPVRFDFLDLRDADARRRACEEEVRVNQPLAAGVVLGVRAVVPTRDGYALAGADAGGAVDWVVEMRRFDEDRTMAAAARRGDLAAAGVEATARSIAAFHAVTGRPRAHDWALELERAWEVNVDELGRAAGSHVAGCRIEAAQCFAASFARRRRADLDRRAAQGRVVDGHGDLRAEHVVLSAGEVTIVDRIEFDAGMRRVDVADDLAFLVMDLHALGAGWAAEALVNAYRAAGGEPGDAALVAAFAVHRALVRAKVGLLRAEQLDGAAASAAVDGAVSLIDLAERLAWTARGPLLLMVAGPPASGKSTVARRLSEAAGWPVLSSDKLRKEALGLRPGERAPVRAYAPGARQRIYALLGARAADALRTGSVVVDATFGDREARDAFLRGIDADGRNALRIVACEAPEATRVERAAQRAAAGADASDAGPDVVRRSPGESVEPAVAPGRRLAVDTTQPLDGLVARTARWLDATP